MTVIISKEQALLQLAALYGNEQAKIKAQIVKAINRRQK